jgi:hypothetical protein
MDKNTALEMAEAYSTDCMNGIASLGSDAESIVEHCWEEIESLRRYIIELRCDRTRLRSALDETVDKQNEELNEAAERNK